MTIFVQAIGIAAMIPAFFSFQQKDLKKLLFLQILSTTLYTIHFSLLGAYAGAILNVLSLARTVVYYFKSKRKWAAHKCWQWIFMALFTVSIAGLLIFSSYVRTEKAGELVAFLFKPLPAMTVILEILPLIGCLSLTYALNRKSAKESRKFSWISSVCWLVYNIVNHSIGAVAGEIINLISIISAIIRLDIKKEKTSE